MYSTGKRRSIFSKQHLKSYILYNVAYIVTYYCIKIRIQQGIQYICVSVTV